MAQPIEPTPVLRGEDARKVIEALEKRCSKEEEVRRMRLANALWEQLTRPKKGGHGPDVP